MGTFDNTRSDRGRIPRWWIRGQPNGFTAIDGPHGFGPLNREAELHASTRRA